MILLYVLCCFFWNFQLQIDDIFRTITWLVAGPVFEDTLDLLVSWHFPIFYFYAERK
jgi:hypothetical protein